LGGLCGGKHRGANEAMKICYTGKDGGAESTVWGFWPIEIKGLFSVALLCFEDGSREAYHNHAFNSVSWVLKGHLHEDVMQNGTHCYGVQYTPSLWPIFTGRDRMHKVSSYGRSWVLTFRGPWRDRWQEYLPKEERERTLTHGRIEC
jgi:hypothetical protein